MPSHLGQLRCGAASAARTRQGPVTPSSKGNRFACCPRPTSTEADAVSGSSLGVPQRSPLHRHHRMRPLSVARGSGLPHPNAFRPCRSSRLRRFAPHTASRVCCTPQPIMGFAWFRADRRRTPTTDPPPRRPSPSKLFSVSAGLPVARLPASSPLVRAVTEITALSSASRPCSDPEFHAPDIAAERHELPGVPSTQAFTGGTPSPGAPAGFPGSARCALGASGFLHAAAAAFGAGAFPPHP